MVLTDLALDTRTRVERTFTALSERGVEPLLAKDRSVALDVIRRIIPAGASVAHGGSTTLQQIGLVEHLNRPDSGYRYLNAEWLAENDAVKRGRLRARLSAEADYFLGSVQALCETGEVIGIDGSGSRQAPYIFGPPHVIWVVGINKLVPTLEAGLRRGREVAFPLEDQRMKTTGAPGSVIGKVVIYERERPGRISLILVPEELGF